MSAVPLVFIPVSAPLVLTVPIVASDDRIPVVTSDILVPALISDPLVPIVISEPPALMATSDPPVSGVLGPKKSDQLIRPGSGLTVARNEGKEAPESEGREGNDAPDSVNRRE
ncbi:hypothetical protein BN14_04039 [Rhizoctonia solani AG-1 IB]|uniref:Secreted protein n=1 Tax=Thanatephorus cucumeris (strain AG1-IB / isolate 7/3/14) TaxID=1108050 RepID=M5BU48_THACB|nr:hypothetical protein BN14_04039 [Rhizoctonia solani AG-1 IB]